MVASILTGGVGRGGGEPPEKKREKKTKERERKTDARFFVSFRYRRCGVNLAAGAEHTMLFYTWLGMWVRLD